MNQPRLLLNLTSHWAIKNFVLSGALVQFTQEFCVTVIAQPSRVEALRSLFSELAVTGVEIHSHQPSGEGRWARGIRQAQKTLLYELHKLPTERISQKSLRGNRSRLSQFLSRCSRLLVAIGLAKPLLRLLRRLRAASTPLVPLPECDIFLNTNPFEPGDDALVKSVLASGGKVVTYIPSWDNLTSKGVLYPGMHGFLVWNPQSKAELLSLYPEVSHDQVVPVGIPRFDVFDDHALVQDSEPLVLFANTATKSFPSQIEVINHLVGRFKLLVRLHPHDRPELYESLAHCPNVELWPAPGQFDQSFGTASAPPARDLLTLSEMLHRAAVVVSSASTIALDAVYCQRPIVSVAYDGDRTLKYEDSIASAYEYNHLAKFCEFNASVLCRSKDELIAAIEEAIAHPERRAAERRALAEFASTPGSVQRIFAELKRFVRAD